MDDIETRLRNLAEKLDDIIEVIDIHTKVVHVGPRSQWPQDHKHDVYLYCPAMSDDPEDNIGNGTGSTYEAALRAALDEAEGE